MSVSSIEFDPTLDTRIKQLDDACEVVVLERMHLHRDLNYDNERLIAEYPTAKALGKMASIAADLDLIGTEITAMSNGAYYTDIDPKTAKMTLISAFGITGRLTGFTELSPATFVYAFDLAPVELQSKYASGVIVPKGFSLVAMGGLLSPEAAKKMFAHREPVTATT